MKKRKKSSAVKSKKISEPERKWPKHHAKLTALFAAKLIIAFLAFTLGVSIGAWISSNPLVIFIVAVIITIAVYFFAIINLVKWLRI